MRPSAKLFLRCAWLMALTALPVLSGCAASRMSNMWREESYKSPALKNVLVVALRPDPIRRRIWEDSFADGLTARGARATQSYKLFADAPPDTEQVIAAVRRDGFDGVLVFSRLPDNVEQTFIPGYIRNEAVTRRSGFTGAYYSSWETVKVPGRTESVPVANFRTDMWTAADDGHLVWSGVTRTTNKVNAKFIRSKVDKLILPALSKAGIVPGESGQ